MNKKGAENSRVKEEESEPFLLLPEETGAIIMPHIVFYSGHHVLLKPS
jgi:hypothetical protein